MLDLQNPETFRGALEGLQTGVCIVDRDRKINYWNDGAESITGYLRQDVVGRFCGDILLIRSGQKRTVLCEQFCPLVAAMRDGRPREARVYLHHKSGYAVPVSLRAVPIRDADGRVIGATESFIERPWVSRQRRPDSNLAVGHGLDALTQLPDYPFTESFLVDRHKYAYEHNIPFGLLCLQLDNLDALRASHGSEAADSILNVVAHTLRNGIDPQDVVGRWSEDQFLALINVSSLAELTTTAERLRKLAESSEIVWWGDELSVTVSIGGTVLVPIESLEVLLERAGNALKGAIAQGGNAAVIQDVPETL